ncbi:MAG TPA: hypothetical protein VKY45_14125 [Marinilabiliaceae bacterium]|nr:hypothetical protein [Marinilabiliaceae bacterium]
MKNKYLWLILLSIQPFSFFHAKGQELKSDANIFLYPIPYKQDLLFQPTQFLSLSATSKLWNKDKTLHLISLEKETASSFHGHQYLNYFTKGDLAARIPTHPGVGDYQNLGGRLLRFNLSDKLTLDYGAFISVQYAFLSTEKQVVVGNNLLFQYSVSNKLQLQTWGQYMTPGTSDDPIFKLRTFFPTTHFGTGLKFDFNEQTKIKMGLEYQYDQIEKAWKPQSGGKVLFKF